MEVVQCGLCNKLVPVHKVVNPAGVEGDVKTCTSCLQRPLPLRKASIVNAVGGGMDSPQREISSQLSSGSTSPTNRSHSLQVWNDLTSANPSQFTQGPRTPPWLKAIGLVEFDLQLGIVVRYLYPALTLSQKQETEIAFLCFPDANLMEDGDSLHDFVYAFNPCECDPTRTSVKRPAEGTEGAASPSTASADRPGYTKDHQEVFCTALFRQKRDPTVTRGARQNAIVIMGDYPFPGIYRQLLSELVVYLETPDADPEQFLLAAHDAVASWPAPLPNHVYSDLPFIGRILNFTTPHYTTSHLWSVPQPALEFSVHRLTEVQRLLNLLVEATNSGSQLPVSSIVSAVKATLRAPQDGLGYQSIIAQFGWDSDGGTFDPPLDHSIVSKMAIAIQDARMAELLSVGSGSTKEDGTEKEDLSPSPTGDSSNSFSSTPSTKTMIGHFRHGTGPSKAMVTYQNQSLEKLQAYFGAIKEVASKRPADRDQCRPASPDQRRYTFSDVQLNAAFFPHITKLWKFWELMITGSPVALVGPSGPNVSAMALSFVSLLAPLNFVGLLRPYLTINNREIDHCIRPIPQPSSIVATTNPFFVKHLAKWPHFLCVGEVDGDVQSHKTLPADSEKRSKQQFKLKNRFFCDRHYLVKTDKTHHAEWLRAPPLRNGQYVDSPEHTSQSSASIRQSFVNLTHEFLQPVRNYILQVLDEERPYFLDEGELRLMFSHTVMMEKFQRPPPSSFSRFKTVGEALDVYEMFFTSPSFQSWLQGLVSSRYRDLIVDDVHYLQDALMLCPNPAKRHEVLTKLQWDLELALRQPLLDLVYLQKLSSLCTEIPSLRLRLVGVEDEEQ